MELSDILEKWKELLKGPKRPANYKMPVAPRGTKVTGADMEARLAKDVDYQNWLKEKEEVGQLLSAAYAKDAKPLLDDLEKNGINIESVWDLVNTKSSYPAAIPILIAHLPRPYDIKNKEGIVRALGVKEAKGIACRVILDEYKRSNNEKDSYRFTFGNAMSVIITPEYTEDVIEIVQDEKNGNSRQMFVASLSKVGSLRVIAVLERLLSDNNKIIREMAQKVLLKLSKKKWTN